MFNVLGVQLIIIDHALGNRIRYHLCFTDDTTINFDLVQSAYLGTDRQNIMEEYGIHRILNTMTQSDLSTK